MPDIKGPTATEFAESIREHIAIFCNHPDSLIHIDEAFSIVALRQLLARHDAVAQSACVDGLHKDIQQENDHADR